MISMAIASAIYLVAMQASIDGPRAAFSACLKQADAKALAEKVTGDGYAAYVKTACTVEAETFKSALVKFDVKNGIARKQAAADADMQIEDYVVTSSERYKLMVAKRGQKGS